MSQNLKIQISRPFGPAIAKVVMPEELLEKLNSYVEKVIVDEKKSKELDHGSQLAGKVKQEFVLERDFIKSSGFLNFLGVSVANWIKHCGKPQIKEFNVLSTWIVRQFKDEYNPVHWHSGHVSGVGYLKVPQNLGKNKQENKTKNENGKLELIHGSKMFLSDSTFTITPKVGDFYFFPNYMMHSVYPFADTNEERRSISFNAEIDRSIYDTYKAG